MRVAVVVAFLLSLPFLVACEREKRDLRLDPPALEALDAIATMPDGISGAPSDVYVAMNRTYEANAYQLSQGKRLYEWFNCTGCHANGGGGPGPAFLDGWWRYGPDPVSIFASIRDGRPHGMPSYRDKLDIRNRCGSSRLMCRQSAAVRCLRTAAPSREDEIESRPAENRGPAGADVPPPSR